MITNFERMCDLLDKWYNCKIYSANELKELEQELSNCLYMVRKDWYNKGRLTLQKGAR